MIKEQTFVTVVNVGFIRRCYLDLLLLLRLRCVVLSL